MPPTTHTAIQGVCAWPNLQLLPDGTVLAFIFNQPCHGRWEGDLDCWASEDGGWTWRFRGRPAPHEPGTNRMNAAAGQTADGAVVYRVSTPYIICGGTVRAQMAGANAGDRFAIANCSAEGSRRWPRTCAWPANCPWPACMWTP